MPNTCPQTKRSQPPACNCASADHTEGLRPLWDLGPIYCSAVTKDLLLAKFGLNPSLVTPLPLHEPVLLPLDETGQETMTVTLFDANHCPGAVMFLFEGYFGRILYTGDFRFSPAMVAPLRNLAIDLAYVDNTYCSPAATLPSRVGPVGVCSLGGLVRRGRGARREETMLFEAWGLPSLRLTRKTPAVHCQICRYYSRKKHAQRCWI